VTIYLLQSDFETTFVKDSLLLNFCLLLGYWRMACMLTLFSISMGRESQLTNVY